MGTSDFCPCAFLKEGASLAPHNPRCVNEKVPLTVRGSDNSRSWFLLTAVPRARLARVRHENDIVVVERSVLRPPRRPPGAREYERRAGGEAAIALRSRPAPANRAAAAGLECARPCDARGLQHPRGHRRS